MIPRTSNCYAHVSGLRLLQELSGEGRFIFTTAEAQAVAARLGIRGNYLSQLLSRLVDGGWLLHLRRGLYAGTGGLPGNLHLHPFAIATRIVTPSAISHWSALQYHGLTEQVPQVVTASTPQKLVTPSMRGNRVGRESGSKHAWEVMGVRYEYVSVSPGHFFGVEDVWVDQTFRVPITDRERTILDGFAAPRLLGGTGVILGILEDHMQDLDLERLIRYALQYGKASVAKRLGWALEQFGVQREKLNTLAELPVVGVRVLDPARPRQGPRDRRWMIQNNLIGRRTG